MKRANGKGGLNSEGYWRITTPDGRRMFQHRYFIELHIGRRLLVSEKVHHIDGNKLNNSLSNLEVCTQAEHLSKHREALINGRTTDGLKILDWSTFVPPPYRYNYHRKKICSVPDCNRVAASWGLCRRHATSYQRWRANK